jgi:3-hydroxyacyl-CoA dehydrogenase
MTKPIRKVAVYGAGVIASGMAAQAANAGCEVVMLGYGPDEAGNNVDRMKKATPFKDKMWMQLMHPDLAKNITVGDMNNDEDMKLIADADLVIEAAPEQPGIKRAAHERINEYASSEAIIGSTTSTIQVDTLMDGMPQDFAERFLNVHPFNPVRFMRLMELIPGSATKPEVVERMTDFMDRDFGKKVVICEDTPGFVGNRIGIFAMYRAIAEAKAQDMRVEDVNNIMNMSFGFPKQGMMKLGDLVGLDILLHAGESLHEGLDDSDEFHPFFDDEDFKAMIEDGYSGDKGKGGFYRKKLDEDGKPVIGPKGKPLKEVRDFKTGEYVDEQREKDNPFFKMKVKGRMSKFFDSKKPAAKFAWPVLRDTLLYTLNHADEIAADIQDIDDAMKTGFNWKKGPFEFLDSCGADWFAKKIQKEGFDVPPLLEKALANGGKFYSKKDGQLSMVSTKPDEGLVPRSREEGVINLDDFKAGNKPLVEHASAKLWDIGDGVTCLEFTSKANALDPSVMHVINESIKLINNSDGKYKAMVLYNEGEHYSVGANLGLVSVFNKAADNVVTRMFGLSGFLKKKVADFVEDLVYQGQAVYKAMREAPFPVIAAPKGNTFGGGCESILHADGIQAGAELYTGLVEVGVGLLPAWGGSARYLERAQNAVNDNPGPKGPMQAMQKAALAISMPVNSVSTSAHDAKKKLWLRKDDRISMNQDRILADAKGFALDMVPDYEPPGPAYFNLPGVQGRTAVRMLVDDMYLRRDDPSIGVNQVDVEVVERVAEVLSGGAELSLEDAYHHVAANQVDGVVDRISDKPDQTMNVHPGITLNEARILQMERDQFMGLFHTDTTKARVDHIITKKVPLREAFPANPPSPAEIRGGMKESAVERRAPDGQPLTGDDSARLESMANTGARTMWVLKKLGMA